VEDVDIYCIAIWSFLSTYSIFVAIWYILWPFGTFSPFWYAKPRKIWCKGRHQGDQMSLQKSIQNVAQTIFLSKAIHNFFPGCQVAPKRVLLL
jgi:hypothetical protein